MMEISCISGLMCNIMDLLFGKLFALSCTVGLGFIARKHLDIDKNSIAKVIFYLLVPLTFFSSIARLKPEASLLLLPLITAVISSVIALLTFYLSKRHFDNPTSAIFSFTCANSNVGYFLLPLVWEIFPAEVAGIFVVMVLGNVIYENSVGFFIAYQGQFTAKESLLKIAKLPALYAVILGFIFSFSNDLAIPTIFNEPLNNIRGAYSALGMMMIGMGLADIKHLQLDFKFIGASLLMKFLVWPLVALIFIVIDKIFINAFDSDVYKLLLLFAIAPLAANNIVISTMLDIHPDKVAASVVLSTLFAIIYIPIVMSLFSFL